MKNIGFLCLLIPAFILSEATSAQSGANNNFKYADSLFLAKDYVQSGDIYKSLITDTSHDALHLNRLAYTELMSKNYKSAESHLNRALASNPSPPLKASIYSRLARVKAVQDNSKETVVLLDSAVANGYFSFPELDTLSDFSSVRSNAAFMEVRNRLYNSLFPCEQDKHAREFDFWIGEWDVYVTGTNSFAGNSVIQRI